MQLSDRSDKCLPALASIVIIGSESGGTVDEILLSGDPGNRISTAWVASFRPCLLYSQGKWTQYSLYEGQLVNRSQMDIKCKACDIRTWRRTFISRHILLQHCYTWPIALRVRRNPQHRSLFDCCLSHFRTSVSTSSSSAKCLLRRLNRFRRQTLPTENRKHFFMNILCTESLCSQKARKKNTALR
jgi:hypothetical protein